LFPLTAVAFATASGLSSCGNALGGVGLSGYAMSISWLEGAVALNRKKTQAAADRA